MTSPRKQGPRPIEKVTIRVSLKADSSQLAAIGKKVSGAEITAGTLSFKSTSMPEDAIEELRTLAEAVRSAANTRKALSSLRGAE